MGTLLTLMFSTGPDQVVERKGFFGAMVFETTKKDNGALGITAGVENPVPLVVLFVALTLFLTVTYTIYRGLKQRREQLLAASGN